MLDDWGSNEFYPKIKKAVYEKFFSNPCDDSESKYKEYRNVLNKAKRDAKQMYYLKEFASNIGNVKKS